MNDLEKYFYENKGRLIDKWDHYFEVYDRYFHPYRGKELCILEIGVFQGGSLRMWKNYFGDKAKVYGLDINPNCKAFEEENVEIFIGSQSDRRFLRDLKKKIPPIDILIDDGGHTMRQQIVTFEELFDHIKPSGIYLCEDLHTSYQLMYGGGHRRRGTFIEYSKNWVDSLNAFFSEQSSLQPDSFTRSVKAIHYYDSMMVVEKSNRVAPTRVVTGTATVDNYYDHPSSWAQKKWKLKKRLLTVLNKCLRFFRVRGFIWR